MANSDIIKIGFDYRPSLAQFEKDTNGVFDGISDKAGKQKITIQLDAKDDKVIEKIKELQKLKLDKFTFEFGDSGLKEQLQTFDKLENKINEIISLSKRIDLSFNTKNKTEAYNQLKKYADAFKNYYGNEEAMATNAGTKAGYAYYKAYEEALRKGVAQSKLEKVTIDANSPFRTKEDVVERRIEEFKKFQKYGDTDESTLIGEIATLENRLLKFNSAYSQVKANLGDAPITPEITKNIEEYVRWLEIAESRAKDAELFGGYSSEDFNSDKDLANMYLDLAKEGATTENKKYIESLKQEETQAVATAEAEQKLAEAQKETVSNTSNSNGSQIEELKSDITEVKTELGDVKDKISSIESNGFENVREDVEKTKESVKELNSELIEMKSNFSSTPQESNFLSGTENSTISLYDNVVDKLNKILELRQKIAQSPTLENGLEGKGEFLKFAEQYKWSPYKDAGFLGESNIKAGYGIYTKAQTKFAKGEVDETYVNNAYTTFVKILTDNLVHLVSGITTGKTDVDYIKQRLQEILPKKMSSFIDEYLDNITSFSKRNAEYNSGGNYIDEESKALKELIELGSGVNQRAEDIFTIDAKDDLQNLFDETKISAENFQSVLESVCNILGIEIPQNTEKAKESVKEVTSTTDSPSSTSNPSIEHQIKSESELNAEIEKRENIIRELQQLQEKLTVHEDFHGNDKYFADQLPTEEEIREADKRIKQLTGTNNIFDVQKLIQDRNEWLSEVKYSLEEYDDLIKTNDQKALDEYTTRGLSRIDGAELFFGYEDNNFSIASKFAEEKEKIQNEINDLYIDLDKLDEKMNLDSNNSSVDNIVQSQEKLQSELKETQEQAEKIQNQVTQSIKEQNEAIDESIKKTLTLNDVRQKQWEIIQKTNPKEEGTNSTWIDNPEDVKTFYEVNHKDSDYPFNENYSDDWTVKDKMNVEATGKITVYSSYPIEDGNWVTPSKEEGLSYAGSGKLYSATIDPRDIAWVDAGQGQVAHISDELKEVIDLSTKAETQVQSIDNKTNETDNQSTLNTLDDTIAKYETIVALVKEYYDLSNNKKDTIGMSSDDDERISEIRKQLKSYTQNPDYDGEYKMGFGGSGKNIFAKSVDLSQEEMLQEICNMLGVEIPKNADKAKEAIKEVATATNSTEPTKDAFPGSSTDTKSETEGMEQVKKTTEEAVQAKKDFATANEGVQSSIDGSENPLKLEAELMEQIAKSAREAANAKKEFVEANKQVKDSADGSNNDLTDGHSENAEPSGVKKYKKKGYKAHDTGNHDNEKKVSNKAELGKALKDLQSEIIASIDESTSFIKEVTDFYDSQDNLVKTQMKVGDKNGSIRTYTTSYSMDKDGNATAWTSHIDTTKIYEQTKQQEKLAEAMAKGREQSEKARQTEKKRQELAQNNAINKALEEEYKQRQKVAQEEEKQIQKNKELALSYTESASKKLSDAISKYSYGDSSDANAMMKQMNRGLSNFGDLSNIESNIKNFDSVINAIITDLKHSHEESLSVLNNEIKAEETIQKQKDAFNKSNLNAIDMEIQKREEEAKAFSNSLKAQMESQQQAESQMSKLENTLSKYQAKKDTYNATIARFKNGGWTSPEYLKNVQAVEDAVKKYETLLSDIKAKGGIASEEDVQKLKEYESEIKKTISTVGNMSASEKGYNFVSAQKELDKIHKILNENTKMSSEAKAKIKAYYHEIESGNPTMSLDRIHAEIMKIYNAEVEAGRAGRSFIDTIKNSGFHQIAAQIAGMFGFDDAINLIKEGINTVRELDTAMTEVRKVSDATEAQYASFRDTISSTAKEIASTNKELLNSSADFLRLGYSLDQASDLAKNATLFVNVGDGVDITEATEDMITAMKAFDIQAEDSIKIVDDYNQIGNKYALSATDIGEAMKRSASALEVGNNSFEESIGLITAMNEIVQNSENTGNSLKVLSLRLRGAKAELEDMGEDTDGLCDSTSKLREQVKALSGVDIMEDDNTFKSTAQQVKELGEAFVKLDDVSQGALLEIIAGKSRSNAVAALLKNYQQIDNVIADLDDAEGSALRENEAIVNSIDGRIKVLSATAEEFWQKFIDTDFVKNAISLATDLLGLLTQIIDKFGTLPIIATGIGAALSFKNVGEWNYISKFHSNNIICFIV